VPFRDQFVRAVLAFSGKVWTEGGDAAISKLMDGPVSKMPVPFMGPPMLIDKKADFAIAQMPAILLYLGLKPENTDVPKARADPNSTKTVSHTNVLMGSTLTEPRPFEVEWSGYA